MKYKIKYTLFQNLKFLITEILVEMFFLRVPMVNGSAEQLKYGELFVVKGKQLKVLLNVK
jgi:hypothetical protein